MTRIHQPTIRRALLDPDLDVDELLKIGLDHAAVSQFMLHGASRELGVCLYFFCLLMQRAGAPFLIYCIYRSADEQAALYALGRTKPGRIVTQARAGQSAHNRRAAGLAASDAFDACPLVDDKPSWETKGLALATWEKMGAAAQKLGLEWGRSYATLGGDWSHFEYPRKQIDLQDV